MLRSMPRWACACCGYLTLSEDPAVGTYEICPVCFWEQDSVQEADPDYRGGANAPSLNDARANYARIGASQSRLLPHVRAPLPDELPS